MLALALRNEAGLGGLKRRHLLVAADDGKAVVVDHPVELLGELGDGDGGLSDLDVRECLAHDGLRAKQDVGRFGGDGVEGVRKT